MAGSPALAPTALAALVTFPRTGEAIERDTTRRLPRPSR